jgi:hypothetical protein
MIENLTIFVLTTGEDPNYEDCMAALRKQTVEFKIDVIRNYAPMSKALQEMLNRCTTDYFIQVDEDMILEPNAVARMYNEINKRPATAMLCYYLQDVYLDVPVHGVKIYTHCIFKQFPYSDNHPSCEMEQLSRLVARGYKWESVNEIAGKHAPKYTPKSIFIRNYTNVRKNRFFNKPDPCKQIESIALNNYLNNKTASNLFGWLGVLCGAVSSMENCNTEKNYKTPNMYYETLAKLLKPWVKND